MILFSGRPDQGKRSLRRRRPVLRDGPREQSLFENVIGQLSRQRPSDPIRLRAPQIVLDRFSLQPTGAVSGFDCIPCNSGNLRPSRLILSQTSAGSGVGYVINSLLAPRCSFVRACWPFFRPDLRAQRCAACRGGQGGRRDHPATCANVCRPRLDGPEHGARIKQVGTKSHESWRTRSRVPC
jgi:hypothetical protein